MERFIDSSPLMGEAEEGVMPEPLQPCVTPPPRSAKQSGRKTRRGRDLMRSIALGGAIGALVISVSAFAASTPPRRSSSPPSRNGTT